MADLRDRITATFQKRVANPLTRLMPTQTLLETIGRKSGQPRRTPVGGSRVGDQFWFVSEFGEKSQYIKNIKAALVAAVQQLRRADLRHQSADGAGRLGGLTAPELTR